MSVYSILYHKHNNLPENANNQKNYSFDACMSAYQNVIIQLMMLAPNKKATMPLHISYVNESFEGVDESYYSVNLLNTKYEEPPKNHAPWGGTNPPVGHYNINLSKYNKYFAVIGTPWNNLIDADVIVDSSAIDTNITNEQMIAEILWEITFYGFSEKKQIDFVKMLGKQVKKVKKSISKKKK